MRSGTVGEVRISSDQDLWVISATLQRSARVPPPPRPLGAAVDPSSFGGTLGRWQRLRGGANESHYIRIYDVSSWFRLVSDFISMLNDCSAVALASRAARAVPHRLTCNFTAFQRQKDI